jgi:hypothetical protein
MGVNLCYFDDVCPKRSRKNNPSEYKAEFDSLKTKISKTLENSKVDGKDIMQTGSTIASVVLNP